MDFTLFKFSNVFKYLINVYITFGDIKNNLVVKNNLHIFVEQSESFNSGMVSIIT